MSFIDLPSYYIYILCGGVGFIFVVLFILLIKVKQRWPYQAVSVMTPVEQKFYWYLKQVYPQYHILAQVQLCRVIRSPRGKNEYKWLNKIWRMSLDYVILDESLNTLLAVELDDRSHLAAKRLEADQRKTKALQAAGVRLVRIRTQQIPNKVELMKLLNI